MQIRYLDGRLPARFWSKTVDTGGCWEWTGSISGGYGRFGWEGRVQVPHRVAYSVLVAPVPKDRQLDHLCRNRSCVNPAHLEPVTQRTNVLRGEGVAAVCARKTHCPVGHEYTKENTYRWKNTRRCRVCRRRQKQKCLGREIR